MSRADRKHLLYVLNDPDFFLSHRQGLAEAAVAAGFQVSVATPPGQRAKDIQRLGFSWHPFPLSRWGSNPVADFRTWQALSSLYRGLRPAIIHHFTVKCVVYGSFAARALPSVRVINSVTGLGPAFEAHRVVTKMRRTLVTTLYRAAVRPPFCTQVFQTEHDRTTLLQFGIGTPERSLLIAGSGVDGSSFQRAPLPAPPYRVLFASRLLRQKGVLPFVESARILSYRLPQVQLLIAGSRPSGHPDALTAEELSVVQQCKAVQFLGEVQNMAELLSGVHLVCLPTTYNEGIPRILLEALASGRGIICSDTPGCRAVCREGETGLLLADLSPAGIAAKIEQAVTTPDLLARLSGGARAFFENQGFSADSINQAFLKLYREQA